MTGNAVAILFRVVEPVTGRNPLPVEGIRSIKHIQDHGVGRGVGHLGPVPVAGHLPMTFGAGQGRNKPVVGLVVEVHRVQKDISCQAIARAGRTVVEPALFPRGNARSLPGKGACGKREHPLPVGQRIAFTPLDPDPRIFKGAVRGHDAAFDPGGFTPFGLGGGHFFKIDHR